MTSQHKILALFIAGLLVVGVGAYYLGYDHGYEKAANPVTDKTMTGTSGIKGTVLLGPQCPVVNVDESCPDKPYEAAFVVMTSDRKETVARFNSDAKGEFSVALKPGEYAIALADSTRPYPSCGNVGVFEITANRVIEVVVHCDTGIR